MTLWIVVCGFDFEGDLDCYLHFGSVLVDFGEDQYFDGYDLVVMILADVTKTDYTNIVRLYHIIQTAWVHGYLFTC